MDHVSFSVRRERHPPTGEWTVLDIRINGVRLQEMVRATEIGPATAAGRPEDAGDYMGLDPRLAATRYFLGEPVTMSLRGDPIRDKVPLGCTCGEPACWPLRAELSVTDAAVTWSNFRGANTNWDLRALGPFTFDRSEYELALVEAAATNRPA